jgi:hypothetical protein
MVDDFVLLGSDKASYPTVMEDKKSLSEIHHMPILTNKPCTDMDKDQY